MAIDSRKSVICRGLKQQHYTTTTFHRYEWVTFILSISSTFGCVTDGGQWLVDESHIIQCDHLATQRVSIDPKNTFTLVNLTHSMSFSHSLALSLFLFLSMSFSF